MDKFSSEDEKFVLNYLEIDTDQLFNAVDPDKERIEFWRNIYNEFNDGLQNAKL